MLRSTLKQLCIKYESSFSHDKLEKVALTQRYDDGIKKKNCTTFTGEYGIELLLYVEDRFRAVCHQLDFIDGDELFNNFEEIFLIVAEEKWTNLVQNLTAQQRTPQEFDRKMEWFQNQWTF